MEVPQTFSELSVHPRARAPSACVFHAAAANKRVHVREARIASREEHRQSTSIVLGKAKSKLPDQAKSGGVTHCLRGMRTLALIPRSCGSSPSTQLQ